jgi:hypothetical protein
MKLTPSLLCLSLVTVLGACHDKGREPEPLDIAMVPEMADALKNSPFTFDDGAFFDARFAGAPFSLTLTSSTAFRAEGKGQVIEGTIVYPTTGALSRTSASGVTFRATRSSHDVAFDINPAFFGFVSSNPPFEAQFPFFGALLTPPNSVQMQFGNILSGFNNSFNLDFEACILGAGVTIGPYGTSTATFTRGCA